MKSKFIIISIILLIVANISIMYFKTYEGFAPTPPTTAIDIKNAVDAAALAMNDNTIALKSFETANQKLENDKKAAKAANEKLESDKKAAKELYDITIKNDKNAATKERKNYNAKNKDSINAAFNAINILQSAPAPIISPLTK